MSDGSDNTQAFLKGGASGAAVGAYVGTSVFPGIGTGVGAAAGFVIGGLAGLWSSTSAQDDAEDETERLRQQQFEEFKSGKATAIDDLLSRRGRMAYGQRRIAMEKKAAPKPKPVKKESPSSQMGTDADTWSVGSGGVSGKFTF